MYYFRSRGTLHLCDEHRRSDVAADVTSGKHAGRHRQDCVVHRGPRHQGAVLNKKRCPWVIFPLGF
jgi:hypothetical protein